MLSVDADDDNALNEINVLTWKNKKYLFILFLQSFATSLTI